MISPGFTTHTPVGPYDLGNLQTLISQMLSGNYSPVGLGFSPPATMGPNPARQGEFQPGGSAGQGDQMQGIWAALAPYLQMIGGQGNMFGSQGGASLGGSAQGLLQQLLTSLLAPGSGSPVAGGINQTQGTPQAPGSPQAPMALTGQPSTGLTGITEGGGAGGPSAGGRDQSNVGAPDLSGPSGFAA